MKRVKILCISLAIVLTLLFTVPVLAANDTGVEGFVTRLYELTLDRQPDAGGFDHWVGLLKSKQKTGADVASSLIFSQEFTRHFLIESLILLALVIGWAKCKKDTIEDILFTILFILKNF